MEKITNYIRHRRDAAFSLISLFNKVKWDFKVKGKNIPRLLGVNSKAFVAAKVLSYLFYLIINDLINNNVLVVRIYRTLFYLYIDKRAFRKKSTTRDIIKMNFKFYAPVMTVYSAKYKSNKKVRIHIPKPFYHKIEDNVEAGKRYLESHPAFWGHEND